MRRATAKMAGMKHVRTIGITGSYGKTSTKEFLFSILSSRYKVAKTSGNNNTNMGVAATVLRDVDDSYDFFLCEMGAYRIGEIKEICAIAQPVGGILTGINEQHLNLFGSLENTKRGKFELLQSLPKDGFAVINEQVLEMKPRVRYAVKDVAVFSPENAQDVQVHPEGVKFTYQDTVFEAGLLGRHYIGNLMAAIMAAEKLGMEREEVRAAVRSLRLDDSHLMRRMEGTRGSIFIDDSYSANPDGVLAALDYLSEAYPGQKRLLVFPGIDELGKDSMAIHQRIWERTGAVCQGAFILQPESPESGRIREAGAPCEFIFEKDFDKMRTELEKRIDRDTVVLFESRGAGVVMRKLLKIIR
jgi:UDP-N-acetylmuramoyl-tripeptide--D-alanyl-D-alanine ligase